MRPSTLFFGCRMPEKSTRKAGFDLRMVATPGFQLGKKHTFEGELMSVIWALFSLCCLYTGCFQASSKRFAHVGAESQTNNIYIHAYKHPHFS